MSESLPTVYLARHGETAWTISRQHTGRTDLPLTARGEDDAWSLHGRLRGMPGRILVFGHGQFFGVLAARWVRLPPGEARRFVLRSASLSILGYEHGPEDPAIRLWNDDGNAVPVRPGGTQKIRTPFVHDRPGFAGRARSCRTGPSSSTASTRPPE